MTEHALVQWLRQNNHFLILTHVRPDGDTLGCASAPLSGPEQAGKDGLSPPQPGDLQKFKGFLTFLWAPDDYMPDHVIAVDIATENLLPQGAHQAYRGRVEVCVDHHASNDGYARELCLDTGASACGEILFRVCRQLGVLDEQIAKALYIAIATDCGGFIYSNTTSETHRIAAALMEYGDFRKLNKHFFQTKSFKQLRLESMVLGSEEFYADGQVCIGKISLADKASVGADEGDCEELASFAASIEGVAAARHPAGADSRRVEGVPAQRGYVCRLQPDLCPAGGRRPRGSRRGHRAGYRGVGAQAGLRRHFSGAEAVTGGTYGTD